MKFSYNWLSEYFKQKLPEPEKLADVLTMRAFEVEGIEKKGDDFIFDIAVLPNRMPDAAGHYFMAREIGAFINSQLKAGPPRAEKLPAQGRSASGGKNQKSGNQLLKITIENPELCPRYAGVVMEGVLVNESPEWIKERLAALGLNSINNLVDIANLVMLETNQPLHIFDFEKIENMQSLKLPSAFDFDKGYVGRGKAQNPKKEIIVRNAKKGESIITLDNKKYDLDENILVIADAKEPLAVAGIKGGKKAEVDFSTNKIIIEAANFERSGLRKTSQKLNLRTDASVRFSAGLSPALADFGLSRAVSLIKELTGGKVVEIIDVYPKKAKSRIINLDLRKMEKLLGEKISIGGAKTTLVNLEFVVKTTKNALKVEVPLERMDVENSEDLIEEIGRVFGYEKINPKSPKINIIENHDDRLDNFLELTRNFFAGQGFNETYNYSFISENDFSLLSSTVQKEILELQNPINPENKFLRPILAINILKNIGLNLKSFDGARIFEIGKTYLTVKEEENQPSDLRNEIPVLEEWHLGVALGAKNLNGKSGFYEMKGILSAFFETFGLEQEFIDLIPNGQNEKFLPFISSVRSAEIKLNGKTVGVLGEVQDEILKTQEIKNAGVLFFEINLSALFGEAKEGREFMPFSRFPSATRDLSLFVSRHTHIVEVEDIINNIGGELLFDCDLFDMYENEKLGGKKSLAFRLVFESKERTLMDKEIDLIMDKIIKTLEEKDGWEVRK